MFRKNLKSVSNDVSGAWLLALGKTAKREANNKLLPIWNKKVDPQGQPFSGQDFDRAWVEAMEQYYREYSTKAGAMPLNYEPPFGRAFKIFGRAALANPNGEHSDAFSSDPINSKAKGLSRRTQKQRQKQEEETLKADQRAKKEFAKDNYGQLLLSQSKEKGYTYMTLAKIMEARTLQSKHDRDYMIDRQRAIKDTLNTLLAAPNPEKYQDHINSLLQQSVDMYTNAVTTPVELDVQDILAALTSPKKGGGGGAAAAAAADDYDADDLGF